VATSALGLLAFGIGENQKDSLILDLYRERFNKHVFGAFVAVILSILLSYQFVIFPVRQFGAFVTRKARGRKAGETNDLVCGGRSLTRWFDILSALTAVAMTIAIATAIRHLMELLDIMGAFGGAYLSYVVPPIWVIQVNRRQANFSWCRIDILGCLALLSLGIFLFTFGTYNAVLQAVTG
jgi:hypothetical protein